MNVPKNKLILVIFAVAIVCLLIWAFFIFRQRNALPPTDTEELKNEQQTQVDDQTTLSNDVEVKKDEKTSVSSDSENNSSDESDPSDITNEEIEKTNLTEVSSEDCDNRCEDFDDSEEFEYCQEVCDIAAVKKDEKNKDCDNLSDLEKDYCLKDLAIKEKDLEICKKIEDLSIEKTCRNRITEDILDASQQQTSD